MLKPGDQLTVQALASLSGESFGHIGEYEVIRDLPDPTIAPVTRIGRVVRPGRLVVARSLARRSVLRRRFDLAHLQLLTYQSDWIDLRRLTAGAKLISMVHDVRPHRHSMPGWIENRLLSETYRRAGHLLVFHEALRDELTADFGIDPALVHVAPIPFDASDLRMGFAPSDGQQRVLFFGTLRRNMGIEVLLDAIGNLRHCDAQFIIAGAGDEAYTRELSERARSLPNLKFVPGFVTAERKRELYLQAACAVLPYTEFHSQSAVLADAYSYRVPVVVSDVGALGHSVRSEGTGLVVPPRDPMALAAAIESVLERPPDLASAKVVSAIDSHDYSRVGVKLRRTYELVVTA